MKKLLIVTAVLFALSVVPAFADVEEILGCTNPMSYNFDPEATVDDDSCYSIGGISFPAGLSSDVVVSGGTGGVTLSFLTNKFMSCGLLVSEDTQDFALNSYGQATTSGLDIFGGVNDIYGYNRLVSMEYGNYTYHQVGVPLEAGNYFIRPYCLLGGIQEILGQEVSVEVK